VAMMEMGGVDAAFDPLGFQSYDDSFSVLKDGGILVGCGANQNSQSGSEQASPYPSMAKLMVRGMLPFASKRTWFYYIEPGTKGISGVVGNDAGYAEGRKNQGGNQRWSGI
jgi:synaptic vesicle membrane protein VAT-1